MSIVVLLAFVVLLDPVDYNPSSAVGTASAIREASMEPPPPPESPQPGGRPRRPASGSPHRRASAAPQPFAADRRGSVSATSEIEVEDVLDGISLASSTSERHDNAPEQRQRSLSFDDLYSLAPVQVCSPALALPSDPSRPPAGVRPPAARRRAPVACRRGC